MTPHDPRIAELVRKAFPPDDDLTLIELLVAFGVIGLIIVTIAAKCGC